MNEPGFLGSTGFLTEPSRARAILGTTEYRDHAPYHQGSHALAKRSAETPPNPRNPAVRPALPPLDCPAGTVRLTILAPRHGGPVYVQGGRVVVTGTAPKYQRLVGLTRAALTAYATQHGWRVVEDTRPRIGA